MLSSRNKNAKRIKALGVAAGLSLMAILLVGATPSLAATSASSYDNVQVFVHTTNSTFSGTYTVTAYNSTGYPVITYSTPYPAASFELPERELHLHSERRLELPVILRHTRAGDGINW